MNVDNPELSIVVPLYNEEECVENLIQTIARECGLLGKTYEILAVDDGSTDQTFAAASGLVKSYPGLRVVKFRRNYGQTPAMAAGFAQARGQIIITMDGDLQNNPADIKKLLDKLNEGYDVVSGWRFKRKDAFLTRTLPSKVANAIISLFTGTYLHDYGCSLKAYKAQFVKPLRFYSDMHRFFPAMASALAGARTAEIPVDHRPRVTGKSKYGLSRIFKVVADLVSIQLITQFSSKPIYWFGALAVPFIMLGGLAAVWAAVHYMAAEAEPAIVVPGMAILIFSIAFHFVIYGLLAEYVVSTGDTNDHKVIAVRIYDIKKDVPIG